MIFTTQCIGKKSEDVRDGMSWGLIVYSGENQFYRYGRLVPVLLQIYHWRVYMEVRYRTQFKVMDTCYGQGCGDCINKASNVEKDAGHGTREKLYLFQCETD